jgi:peptidoglycan-associated lipoprotein
MLTEVIRMRLARPCCGAAVVAVALLACTIASTAHGEPAVAGQHLAQRVTKPGDPPPPAPAPPTTQPRTGVSEPPTPGTAQPPATVAPAEKSRPPRPAFEPVTVIFAVNSATLTDQARATLDKLAATLAANPTVRVMVKAYTGTGGSVSETRRLSLQRGTAVRTYLIGKGFPARRIDLQPLGTAPDEGARDRVDVTAAR